MKMRRDIFNFYKDKLMNYMSFGYLRAKTGRDVLEVKIRNNKLVMIVWSTLIVSNKLVLIGKNKHNLRFSMDKAILRSKEEIAQKVTKVIIKTRVSLRACTLKI